MPSSPDPCDGLSRESHGRRLTTTSAAAAANYRAAQSHFLGKAQLTAALRAAEAVDPGFALARADLAALHGRDPVRGHPAIQTWERHHLEVVAAAADGDVRRAVDLLREHLAEVACDPVALAVVLDTAGDEPLDDILAGVPPCHRPAR